MLYVFIGGGASDSLLGPCHRCRSMEMIKTAVDDHWRTGRQSVGQMMSVEKGAPLPRTVHSFMCARSQEEISRVCGVSER